MIRRLQTSTRTDTLVPHTTRYRSRQRDAAAGRDTLGEGVGQRVECGREDVGDHDRIRRGRLVVRQKNRQRIADAVAIGVVTRGQQRLRIVVDANRARCAELERGQRADAAAAAELQPFATTNGRTAGWGRGGSYV